MTGVRGGDWGRGKWRACAHLSSAPTTANRSAAGSPHDYPCSAARRAAKIAVPNPCPRSRGPQGRSGPRARRKERP